MSTFVTPSANQAALSASWRSAHERRVPRRITSLPLGFAVTRLASSRRLGIGRGVKTSILLIRADDLRQIDDVRYDREGGY
jgi:hypothetical protein